ncbi:hypothetical protein A0H81_13173 [Grifola frondosa]|uniref:VWFA domain-containing protein n=1 Tax=Grifola frondosa TaxID=5627 RepID=A0A1C7LQN4_GRIFR|nr:hypothetical protein A0H81_13173 [Grifola frondosa]
MNAPSEALPEYGTRLSLHSEGAAESSRNISPEAASAPPHVVIPPPFKLHSSAPNDFLITAFSSNPQYYSPQRSSPGGAAAQYSFPSQHSAAPISDSVNHSEYAMDDRGSQPPAGRLEPQVEHQLPPFINDCSAISRAHANNWNAAFVADALTHGPHVGMDLGRQEQYMGYSGEAMASNRHFQPIAVPPSSITHVPTISVTSPSEASTFQFMAQGSYIPNPAQDIPSSSFRGPTATSSGHILSPSKYSVADQYFTPQWTPQGPTAPQAPWIDNVDRHALPSGYGAHRSRAVLTPLPSLPTASGSDPMYPSSTVYHQLSTAARPSISYNSPMGGMSMSGVGMLPQQFEGFMPDTASYSVAETHFPDVRGWTDPADEVRNRRDTDDYVVGISPIRFPLPGYAVDGSRSMLPPNYVSNVSTNDFGLLPITEMDSETSADLDAIFASLLNDPSSDMTNTSWLPHEDLLVCCFDPELAHGISSVLDPQDTKPLGTSLEYVQKYLVVALHMSLGPSNSLTSLPHPLLDLILVILVPAPNATPSTAALKVRVIRASFDFIIIASLSAKNRLSLVTFEVGIGGNVRRTPFLCLGKGQSRARLSKFVDEIGRRDNGMPFQDEFLVRGSQDDKTDVVTAVNNGLDVVLQRKSRNPVTGMVLVSDTSDTTRRAQMDLVLARAEAANVPIHSFGYGRSHDPASLWLMSNHTSGTYTFVKDWYDLRDCLAGCIGGMMSIGLLHMKLHMKIVDGQRFRIRKISGGPASILSSDGRDVDVEVGELRYGERKEMLIELELDNSDLAVSPSSTQYGSQSQSQRAMNATDQFNQRMGLDALSIGDLPDLAEGMMDRMIDEVPVFEVDGSFFDPAAGKNVSRLAHPVLLTVTLLPNTGTKIDERDAADIAHRPTKHLAVAAPPNREGGTTRNRKELLTLSAVRAIQSVMQDMQILSEALDEHIDTFAHDQRNFGAQQAMVLRDQKSWSGRSAIERLFWTIDNSIELVSRSTDWVARE